MNAMMFHRPPVIRFLAALALGISCGGGMGFAQSAKQAKTSSKEPFSWVSPLSNPEVAKKTLPPTVKHATFKSPFMDVDVGYYIYLPPWAQGLRVSFA
jgi:hypothetical protein